MSFLFVSSDAFPGPKWLITRGLWIWLPLVTKSVWKQPCCAQSNIPNERDSLCREAWILGCFINHTEIFSKVLYRIGRASVTWDIMKVLAINVFIFTFRKGKVVNLMQPSQASLAVRFLEARNRKGLRAVHRWPSLMRVEKALWDSCWLVCLVTSPIIVSGAIIAQIAQIAANIPERPFCNPVIRGTAQVYQFVRWPKFGKVPENLLKKRQRFGFQDIRSPPEE